MLDKIKKSRFLQHRLFNYNNRRQTLQTTII